MRERGSGEQRYAAIAEADGSFTFEGIEPGDYTLSGERYGFLRTQLGAKRASGGGTVITLRPGQQLSSLNLALIPQGVISGKVIDEDGEPVNEVMVQAIRQQWIHGKLLYLPHGNAQTNDLGEFRIAGLEPGKYYLSCQQMELMMYDETPASSNKPDVRPVRTFYPDAITRDAAALIAVRAGQDVSGTDIRLRTTLTHHVRGKVMGEIPGDDPGRLMVSILPQEDEMPMFFRAGSRVGKNRTFDLAGIPPGAYTLTASSVAGKIRGVGRRPIEVGSSDLNGVVLSIVPPTAIRGQIHIEGTPTPQNGVEPKFAQIGIFLSSADQNPFFSGPSAEVKSDGTFTVENVSPGKYYVEAMNGPQGSYLKSIRAGQQEVLGKEIDWSQGASGELEIVFRYGAAEVEGTLQSTQSAATSADQPGDQPAPHAPVSIVLVSDVLYPDGTGTEFGSTNQYGTFNIKRVRPGHYRAYAFEQPDMNQLQNPVFLKQLESTDKGIDVDVKENDKKQIQLPVISKDDFEQLVSRLGIESE